MTETPTCCITQQGRGRNMKKHLFHYRESNPTKTIMENQCYSHEPHWELSKKELKNGNCSIARNRTSKKPLWKNQRYPHGLR